MKTILITGANSYIGVSFETYLKKHFPSGYAVDTIDMIDGTWREKDFSGYDAVFHVAGIAHRKETRENAGLYYRVNRDLAVETARKAKVDGAGQFVFLSSMSVYGRNSGEITGETVPAPQSHYGTSKLQAEEGLEVLADAHFPVCILRPPMVYGRNCKGNYQRLRSFAMKIPVFPCVNNRRSMIYIENLCEYIRLMMENRESGIFFPQNREYVNTTFMVGQIAGKYQRKVFPVKGFGWMIAVLSQHIPLLEKVFGNLTYEMDMSQYPTDYQVCSFEESIGRTEGFCEKGTDTCQS